MDVLVVPGGRALAYIRLNDRVLEIVGHYFDAKQPLLAICQGAQVLAAAGFLGGRECSAYPTCDRDVTRADGHYQDIPVDAVHVDGNLVI